MSKKETAGTFPGGTLVHIVAQPNGGSSDHLDGCVGFVDYAPMGCGPYRGVLLLNTNGEIESIGSFHTLSLREVSNDLDAISRKALYDARHIRFNLDQDEYSDHKAALGKIAKKHGLTIEVIEQIHTEVSKVYE